MIAPLLAALVALMGCQYLTPEKSKPEKPTGVWELYQEETTSKQVDAIDAILETYPGCIWGRMTWTFQDAPERDKDDKAKSDKAKSDKAKGGKGDDPVLEVPEEDDDVDKAHLLAGLDVLCPASVGDYYGCEVSARVPATWDEDAGKFVVEYPVAARSRTVGIGDDAIPGPTSCEVAVPAGDFPVVRVRNREWRWEMRTPNGKVYRLRLPRSDRPDFVSPIQGGPGGAGEASP